MLADLGNRPPFAPRDDVYGLGRCDISKADYTAAATVVWADETAEARSADLSNPATVRPYLALIRARLPRAGPEGRANVRPTPTVKLYNPQPGSSGLVAVKAIAAFHGDRSHRRRTLREQECSEYGHEGENAMTDRVTIRISPELSDGLDRFIEAGAARVRSRQDAFRHIVSTWLVSQGYMSSPTIECADQASLDGARF